MRMRGSKELKDAERAQARRVAKDAHACFDAVEGAAKLLLPRAFEAMNFLREIAGLLAKEGKALSWTTPSGFPWQSRYHKADVREEKSWIGGKTVKVDVAIGDLPQMRVDKAKRAGAPNVVHGLDAAHLHLVALWACDARIPLVTVHDCFGCLAADAHKFRIVVHDKLAQMYPTTRTCSARS
jgi:DNA-directed RNA polymerase